MGLSALSSVQLYPGPILNMDVFTTCPVCPLVGESREQYKCKRSAKAEENGGDDKECNEAAWKDFVDHVAWCLEVFSMKAMESSVNDNPVLPETILHQTVTELDASPLGVTAKPLLPPSLLENILDSAPSRWLNPFRKARPQPIQEDFDPPRLNKTNATAPPRVPRMPRDPSSMVINYYPSSSLGSGKTLSSESASIRYPFPVQQTISGLELYLKAYSSYERLVSGSPVPHWHRRNALEAIRGVMSIPVH